MMRVKLNESAPSAYLNRAVDGIVDVANNHGEYLIKNNYATLIEDLGKYPESDKRHTKVHNFTVKDEEMI